MGGSKSPSKKEVIPKSKKSEEEQRLLRGTVQKAKNRLETNTKQTQNRFKMDSKWAKSRKREEVIGRDSPSKTLKMARKNDSKRTEKRLKMGKKKRNEKDSKWVK